MLLNSSFANVHRSNATVVKGLFIVVCLSFIHSFALSTADLEDSGLLCLERRGTPD